MAKSIKVKAGEKLDEPNIKAVIKALSDDKPCSKKEACGMLNITYNTTRLNNIIEDYESKIAFRRKQRAAVRKTPITTADKKNIVQSFVSGDAIGEIVKASYRSLRIVQTVLKEFNLPTRVASTDRVLIEEHQTAEDYSKGDLVYSAKYGAYAEIIREHSNTEEGKVYQIYVLGSQAQNAYQPYYELIDLRAAQDELDINVAAPQGINPRVLPKGYA